eukprot:scaffold8417_cov124-Alexandrium_tamarense.AAC.1
MSLHSHRNDISYNTVDTLLETSSSAALQLKVKDREIANKCELVALPDDALLQILLYCGAYDVDENVKLVCRRL